MTDRELMQQALEALNRSDYLGWQLNIPIIKSLRERLAQEPNMPEQYVMVGRFMLQPHPENGYWLTDTGTSEAMQIFQPEMERVIKELWKQF